MNTKSDPEHVGGTQPTPENEDTVAVYRFEVWDRKQGRNVVYAYMAAPDAIRRMKGMADLSSKLIVNKAALDDRGFYSLSVGPS